MPVGLPYFAWIDASETTFTSGHMRWDEQVFSFTLEQGEGDPASLTLTVRRPRNVDGDPIGLLGPGRKIWAWFALDCGGDLIRFRGRLVGVPTSIFEELVTLEFVARPIDVVAQKEALAASLRVLPYYDEVVIEEERRNDPEVVLEGYSKIWHYNRETHDLTVSDEISGEDGLVEFDGFSEAGKVLYDGLGLTLASGPLTRVDVKAEYSWTQLGTGNVDLTDYIVDNGPHVFPKTIVSYTLTPDNWPKVGTTAGEGWEVVGSSCYEIFSLQLVHTSGGYGSIVDMGDGDTSETTYSWTRDEVPFLPPGSINIGYVQTNDWSVTHGDGGTINISVSEQTTYIPAHHIKPTLVVGYRAERQYTERVSVSLIADVQPILTDPANGETLLIDGIKSVNLSEPIGGVMPIGDARRRSYIATDRGNGSIEHLICLARTHLLKRARVVEIGFAPKLARMPEVSLRKNAYLSEPRVGEAIGKIIGYSVALDGSDGRIDCEVRIGCTIGYGGSVSLSDGTPGYCSAAYVGADYQQFIGRTVSLDASAVDTSVGYQPPTAAPNDDGLNLQHPLTVAEVIDIPILFEFGPDITGPVIRERTRGYDLPKNPVSRAELNEINRNMAARAGEVLSGHQMRISLKLKSMTRAFVTDYEIQTTDLKIPTGYDLEAA